MAEPYTIFGSEMSPYSVKVRSYFRYKEIPHLWAPRNAQNEETYRKAARLPLVPTVVTPKSVGVQDSTPIIEALEAEFPSPTIHPPSPELAFLSALIEEFGDEWGNKLMFHHRWHDELDQRASALILARLSLPDGAAEQIESLAQAVRTRMSGRGAFVGSSQETAPLITKYYFELIDILQGHLAGRRYLFGARPAFADFGLALQLYEASIDPTCGSIMRARGLNVLDWCLRMVEPDATGPFEEWDSLRATLTPLLAYVGRTFLPWSAANAEAMEAGAQTFAVDLAGDRYVQSPQKYHAKSLRALREKYLKVSELAGLDAILDECGCRRFL
ncbi:MAG: glutathione S-transferase N-terminal domain-containing protein [Caulobacteraceae bacterium]